MQKRELDMFALGQLEDWEGKNGVHLPVVCEGIHR
jgi:hypothetical protein